MTNMEVWNAVKQPPSTALKPIKGGRISGMTDINPQWRYQVMTEQFGMAGVGWGYSIKRLWAEPCNDGQVFAFAEIELWTKDAEKTIPGIGGSMLITKEQSGLHASDEGYKMAVTDALSVAMKMLGVGANVYAGLSDTKYASKTMVDAAKEAGAVEKKAEPKAEADPTLATEPQLKAIFAIQRDMGITDDLERHEHVSRILEFEETLTSFKTLTKSQASKVIKQLNDEKNA